MMTDIRHYPFDTWWGPLGAHGDPDDDLFDAPLEWDEPTVARVDGLFEPDRDFEVIAAVYGVMAAADQHTYQVVTEHPERARDFFNDENDHLDYMVREHIAVKAMQALGRDEPLDDADDETWPLPHVWLGTRASDQSEADARIPPLLECPAAARLVELAPLTGAVDLKETVTSNGHIVDALRPHEPVHSHAPIIPALDWIIVGGTTDSSRATDIGHLQGVVDQCRDAGVPCYVTQLGKQPVKPGRGYAFPVDLDHPHGADPREWPEGLRVREMPEGVHP